MPTEAMTRKKRVNRNRLLIPGWRGNPADFNLWDRNGDLWTGGIDTPLDRAVIEHEYFDSMIPVVISDGGGAPRWVEAEDRRSVWERELRDRTLDLKWKARGSSGSLPFRVYALTHADRHLLLFYDHD